jgi:hypothetical protein
MDNPQNFCEVNAAKSILQADSDPVQGSGAKGIFKKTTPNRPKAAIAFEQGLPQKRPRYYSAERPNVHSGIHQKKTAFEGDLSIHKLITRQNKERS